MHFLLEKLSNQNKFGYTKISGNFYTSLPWVDTSKNHTYEARLTILPELMRIIHDETSQSKFNKQLFFMHHFTVQPELFEKHLGVVPAGMYKVSTVHLYSVL